VRNPIVDAYWSFRSPYSYIALPRMRVMREEMQVQWNFKVVSPLAIRLPEHFTRQDRMARPYLLLDSARAARYLGIPFGRPRPDPIVQDPDTLAIAKEQPHIHRLTRLGAAATGHGRAFELAEEVGRMLWDGTVDGWNQGDHLERAVRRAGLDLHELEAEIAADPARFDALIRQHEQEQRAARHWGVPMFVYDGEPYFGQDRLEHLAWRIAQDAQSPA